MARTFTNRDAFRTTVARPFDEAAFTSALALLADTEHRVDISAGAGLQRGERRLRRKPQNF